MTAVKDMPYFNLKQRNMLPSLKANKLNQNQLNTLLLPISGIYILKHKNKTDFQQCGPTKAIQISVFIHFPTSIQYMKIYGRDVQYPMNPPGFFRGSDVSQRRAHIHPAIESNHKSSSAWQKQNGNAVIRSLRLTALSQRDSTQPLNIFFMYLPRSSFAYGD